MSLMPFVYTLTSELGLKVGEHFHKQWREYENELADVMDKFAKARPMRPGPLDPIPPYETDAIRRLLEQQTADPTKTLIRDIILNRCFKNPEYTIGGGHSCLELLSLLPVKSHLEPISETIRDAAIHIAVEKLGHSIAEKWKEWAEEPYKDQAICALAPQALRAGVQVGPATFDQLKKSILAQVPKAALDAAMGEWPSGMMLSVPGVTQVQYYYKGLASGQPEARTFKIRGRLESTPNGAMLKLEQDGEVTGGDTKLWVEYMVNYHKERKPFPTWSPFLASSAEFHPGQAVPFAQFREAGEHRNGVKPWREYDYNWSAYKVTSPR